MLIYLDNFRNNKKSQQKSLISKNSIKREWNKKLKLEMNLDKIYKMMRMHRIKGMRSKIFLNKIQINKENINKVILKIKMNKIINYLS